MHDVMKNSIRRNEDCKKQRKIVSFKITSGSITSRLSFDMHANPTGFPITAAHIRNEFSLLPQRFHRCTMQSKKKGGGHTEEIVKLRYALCILRRRSSAQLDSCQAAEPSLPLSLSLHLSCSCSPPTPGFLAIFA